MLIYWPHSQLNTWPSLCGCCHRRQVPVYWYKLASVARRSKKKYALVFKTFSALTRAPNLAPNIKKKLFTRLACAFSAISKSSGARKFFSWPRCQCFMAPSLRGVQIFSCIFSSRVEMKCITVAVLKKKMRRPTGCSELFLS